MAFWRWVEERIQNAMHAGEFDSLPGRGRPMEIKDDPLAPPEERLSRHIMQNAGVKPAWVELADEIQKEIEAAQSALARAADQIHPGDLAWARAVERFERQVDEVNQLIKRYNLMVPNPRLARSLLDPEAERQQLLDS
jgi:DnaJ family protein C protein 28